MINELIEQIGRERLEAIVYAMGAEPCNGDPILDSVTHGDIGKMARALLSVLDAQDKAVAWMNLREGDPTWPRLFIDKDSSDANVNWVELRPFVTQHPLYATPPAASEPVSNGYKLPDGYILVPIEPTWGMLSSDGCSKHHDGQECSHHENRKRIWRAMLAAAPAPGGE